MDVKKAYIREINVRKERRCRTGRRNSGRPKRKCQEEGREDD